MARISKYPPNLQAVLWSKDISKLDLELDKIYIIHQVLAYGTWDHLKWLFSVYAFKELREIFQKYPEKDYTEKSFNFARKILLELPQDIDKTNYVKTFSRIS